MAKAPPIQARHRLRRTAANLFRGLEGSFVRERRNYLLILGAIAALLVGAALLAVPGSPAYKKPTLGLDLQGGLEVVLRAVPQKGQSIDPQQMQVAQQVITHRTNASGLSAPNIAIQGGNEIVIQLAGVHDTAKAAKTIGSTGQLQMFDFETSLVSPTVQGNQQPAPVPSRYGLLKAVQTKENKGSRQAYYLCTLPPAMTGTALVDSGTDADVAPSSGSSIVTLQFTGHGSHEFKRITELEYNRGRLNAGQAGQLNATDQNTIATYAGHNAIVLDGELQETPYIDYTDSTLSLGIAGNAQITEPNADAAKSTALVLQSGSLPYTFTRLQQTEVSATLGKSSLHQALWAAAIGLLVVAIFLLILYRFLGLVAVFGLAIYAALYYAAILLFDVTLTLPGFAGLILTIGVAADANVVVFERIKEEVRAGRSVRAAIAAGYGKGFHTILDANVVTVITAMVVYLIAVADVKGFALMLLIGTVISLLTAVVATRAMLGLLSGFRWFDSPRFMGAEGQQTAKWLQIDFMGKRNLWFGISGAVILAGVISLATQGLNLGIDFKGGTQLTFKTHKPYSQGEVQRFMASQGQPDAVVQGQGKSVDGDFKDWQVRTKSLTRQEQNDTTAALKADLGIFGGGAKSVSGTFGHQIAIDAIYGIIVSLLLITVFIAIRFDFKFAMPVILAMLHDIAVTVGVYALVGKEVSVGTVAAVLTVLGYSIYDTIIIFDRIRENIPLMRRSPFATIANVSLWETIRRSLATTFITLLPIICLLILGGQTLKDFAFALIIGVISGAYSSIFIAAPLLTMWKEREPDYARRKHLAEPEGGEPDGGTPARRRPWQPKGGPALDPGTVALQESEAALSAEATPSLLDAVTSPEPATASARREKRSQRRRSRPHGRAR